MTAHTQPTQCDLCKRYFIPGLLIGLRCARCDAMHREIFPNQYLHKPATGQPRHDQRNATA